MNPKFRNGHEGLVRVCWYLRERTIVDLSSTVKLGENLTRILCIRCLSETQVWQKAIETAELTRTRHGLCGTPTSQTHHFSGHYVSLRPCCSVVGTFCQNTTGCVHGQFSTTPLEGNLPRILETRMFIVCFHFLVRYIKHTGRRGKIRSLAINVCVNPQPFDLDFALFFSASPVNDLFFFFFPASCLLINSCTWIHESP